MMTLQKTVEIPADRRLFLELPENLPDGLADITLKIKPHTQKNRKAFTESLGNLYGCLKDSETFADSPVEIQRKMRDEWSD
jgi:hypothetical protein